MDDDPDLKKKNALRYEFAKSCFLDIADHDYVAARALFRSCCYHQSFILMQQAIEKYLKAILLYNSIPHNTPITRPTHDLGKLLDNCSGIADFFLHDDVNRFIRELNGMDHSRYLTYSTAGFYDWLPILDKCIWQLRVFAQADTKENKETIGQIMSDGLDKYVGTKIISDGNLERILAGRVPDSSELRDNLTWQNHYYFEKGKKQPLENIIIGGMPLLSLFDSYGKLLYGAVKDLIYIPDSLRNTLEKLQ